MNKKVVLILALLCAVVQGAWAQTFDVWDGHTLEVPSFTYGSNGMVITKASQLAYIRAHWEDQFPETPYPKIKDLQIFLNANIDMGETSWVPLPTFTQAFYGQNFTIRINISGATDNYQGLFQEVAAGAEVIRLHVDGKISCTDSRLVGGIAGENYGTIENCWVSADVSTDWTSSLSALGSKVGGITGENHGTIQYCCMSGNVTNNDAEVGGLVGYNNGGTIDNCTFYGTRYSTHDQDNVYVGEQKGTLTNYYDNFATDADLTNYLNSVAEKYNVYREALQRPFSVTTSSEGYGTVTASSTTRRPGQTVSVTVSDYTTLTDFSVKDADGTDVTLSGNATDGYTFTMPKRNVNVTATFSAPNWIDADKRAAAFSNVNGNTVTIMNAAEMGLLSYLSNTADWNYGQGMTFLLNENIDMSAYQWTPISRREANAFRGTFDGQGHALSGINVSVDGESYAGLFGVLGSTYEELDDRNPQGLVQNLKLVNSSITQTATALQTGGIAGYLKNGQIKNCYVGRDVTVTAAQECGGVAGTMAGWVSRIEGCYSAATVRGNHHVGGIVATKRWGINTWDYSDTGYLYRNVSQADIQLFNDANHHYAYIYSENASTSYPHMESNFYIDRPHINDTDTRAYHVTLDDALKECGYSITYPDSEYDEDSEYEYDCSGLTFKSLDQFLLNGEWYVAKNKPFTFNPTNDLDGALLSNITAGGTMVNYSDDHYHFTTEANIILSGTMELLLANNGDNSSLLNRFKNHTANVTLADRTLYRDGHWNTLYLPFSLSAEQLAADDCPLKGATIKSLSSSSFGNNTLTLNFSDAQTSTVDGVPYIVKWETTGDAIENPVFKNVTIVNAPGQTTTGNVYFKGSFSPVAINGADHTMLYLGSGNQLYYPSQAMTIGSCRAYFQLRGLTVADPSAEAPIRAFKLNFDGDETTGITTLDSNSQLSTVNSQLQGWYTLQGVKLAEKPVEQGIYLFNGKKVLIK